MSQCVALGFEAPLWLDQSRVDQTPLLDGRLSARRSRHMSRGARPLRRRARTSSQRARASRADVVPGWPYATARVSVVEIVVRIYLCFLLENSPHLLALFAPDGLETVYYLPGEEDHQFFPSPCEG